MSTPRQPSGSTDYTSQANAIIDQAVTAPGTLAGEAGYWFRKQDANNGYKAYLIQPVR
ncbi:MAG: hypothetical protein IPL78_21105, partial [Chloroflexi bacterium]|nr:hypothetical protein [Chloroflexota bacterium]